MKLTEVKGDIFARDRECMIQCVSADFKLGAGIAKEFSDRFRVRDKLLRRYGTDYGKFFLRDGGGALVTEDPLVINLVTKEHYYDKPTYDTMLVSLMQAAMLCEVWEVFEVSMPLIGCGLDKLEWERVRRLVEKAFNGLNMLVTVYRKE